MSSHPVPRTLQRAPDAVSIHSRLLKFRWPRSITFNLAVAVMVGFLYSLWVMGPGPLNPRNIKWLTGDRAQHQIAWELFRQDPNLHWPITFTDRVGYPYGESVSLLDPNPLIAVLLKLFSRFLPEPCQYQGPEVAIICILQFFFALLLFRVLFGPNPLKVFLPALFFLLAPPLNWRFVGHYAMDNHWLLLASLLLFCVMQRETPLSSLKFTGYAVLLAGAAVAINPYLTFQVLFLLAATLVSLIWRRRITIGRAMGIVVLLGITGFVVASAFGLIIHGGRGYDSGGYRMFSLNLLGLIDPQDYGSVLLPKMPSPFFGQYEGYSYLGLGVILLAIVSLPILIRRRRKFPFLHHRIVLPLFGACLVLTVLALSTKITFGSSVLIDLDPHQKLTPYLAVLRASGRLFWTPYYVLLGAILAASLLSFRKTWAITIMSAALALQVADTSGLRHWVHSEVNAPPSPSPLPSPVWSKLGSVYQNLMVMPPWQCGVNSTPGGANGFQIFGFLAVAQHMRTNSYYAARYTEVNRQKECSEAVSALSSKPLSPNSAYVVTYMLAQQIAKGPNGPGKCHDVDHFILCTAKNDFGLSPILNPGKLLQDTIADPGFENSKLSGWRTFQNVTAVPSEVRAHNGTRSLAETAGVGSVYQDAIGLVPGRTYVVSAWISGTPGATAAGQIALYDPGANIAISSKSVTPTKGWQLIVASLTVHAPGAIRIHLFRKQGSGTIFWDDVRIYQER